ncbi:MAG: hypothetical protein AMXMBFR78_14560 [Rubrivivax sp.]
MSAASSGRPTLRRRGAQSARGRPIRDRAIGAATMTPRASPSHQVHQAVGAVAVGITPPSIIVARVSVALSVQGSRAPSRQKATMSRGSRSGQSRPSRSAPGPSSSRAPSAACAAAARPLTAATSQGMRRFDAGRGPESSALTRKAASATPGSTRQP